uniref:RNA-binding protein NOB1 n=1 Tax=Hydra vulgaris TaxID=6087 RepID=T2M3I8_HYDVU
MDQDSSFKLSCIVADSAAFIRNVDLQSLGKRIFTIGEVIDEIRDCATKQRLSVLPYEIEFREPSSECLKFVSEFSKKTGDFKSLSAVDLRVIALTYQLEKEFCGVDHIRSEPTKKCVVVPKGKLSDKEISGFFIEKKVKVSGKKNDVNCKILTSANNSINVNNDQNFNSQSDNDQNDDDQNDNGESIEDQSEEFIKNQNNCFEDEFVENAEDDNNNDDDDSGWITPRNIEKIKEKMDNGDEVRLEDANIKCACLTTDFAMQNVMIQMGLHVVSVNGMLIRHARNYIQKCYGCYKETHNMEETFCPSCGNKTLLKVSVTIDSDGTVQYHYPKRGRNFNIRGTKFSIPIPKSGRHNTDNVVLCADQHIKTDRLPKRRDKINPLDPDYEARVSPFSINDTTSRAFIVGAHVKNSRGRNPNEAKKKSRKK